MIQFGETAERFGGRVLFTVSDSLGSWKRSVDCSRRVLVDAWTKNNKPIVVTVETSVLLIEPFTLTSVRKLLAETGLPLCFLVWLTSVLLTALFAVVSPRSAAIGTTTLPVRAPSFTPAKVMAIVCALDTPVRF